MSARQKPILVIGGTGAQGVPVVEGDFLGTLMTTEAYTCSALASDGAYSVRVISRSASSKESLALASIAGVTIFQGDTYDEPTLRKAFEGVEYVFANTNAFAIGEKAEIYWGIRMYELAAEFGVKHFVYGGLEYASKLGNFQAKYRTGHLDGRAKSQTTSPPSQLAQWLTLS
jgi:nucleoside-diphosphate-sugar epimerase